VANNKQIPQRSGRLQRKRVEKSARPPEGIDDKHCRWSVADIDHKYEGDWEWKLEPKDIADLLDLLERMSALTWREVKELRTGSKGRSSPRPLHHHQKISSICPAAQKRLAELEIDVETVCRLRHGNKIASGVVSSTTCSESSGTTASTRYAPARDNQPRPPAFSTQLGPAGDGPNPRYDSALLLMRTAPGPSSTEQCLPSGNPYIV
jgi:hypothetical protein